jgi:hypothetical protein
MTIPHVLEPREAAFEALLPLALPTRDALARMQEKVSDDLRLTAPLRTRFHPTRRASHAGNLRFDYTIIEWGAELAALGTVPKMSSEIEESQNIYHWLLEERYVLRVKHDLTEVTHPGVRTLFTVNRIVRSPEVIYLTWSVDKDGTVFDACFASVEEPKWTITLKELVAQAQERPEEIRSRLRLNIRSTRRADSDEQRAADAS